MAASYNRPASRKYGPPFVKVSEKDEYFSMREQAKTVAIILDMRCGLLPRALA